MAYIQVLESITMKNEQMLSEVSNEGIEIRGRWLETIGLKGCKKTHEKREMELIPRY